MKRALNSLFLLTALLFSSHAFALTYTEYTDRTAFEAAITGASMEDFNAEAVAAFTTREFTDFTVTNMNTANIDTSIDSGAGDTQVNGTNYLKMYSRDDNPQNGMDLEFKVPVGAIGFDWRNSDTSNDRAQLVILVDGEEFIFGSALSSGFFGVVATEGAFGTVKFADTPGDGGYLESLGLDDITYTSAEPSTTARFQVTKTFLDQATDEVEVTLTCNGGLPLQQSFTIAGGGPGVTFTVTDIPDTGADCEVTETGGVDNYTPSFNNGTVVNEISCEYIDVTSGAHTCSITNASDPADYVVAVDWMVGAGGVEEETYAVEVTVNCLSNILTVNDTVVSPSTQYVGDVEENSDVTLGVDTTAGDSGCSATQSITQSGVESEASADCTNAVLTAGGGATCTFSNTVFFEGIPTLSQYGMAILALLMLSIGFVGFRRFV